MHDDGIALFIKLMANFAYAAAAIGCAYLIIASVLVRRFGRTDSPKAPTASPSVTLLKPLCGDEPGLVERLTSFCKQEYDGDIQLVFGCHDPSDPAVSAVRQIKSIAPESDIELVSDSRLHGMNRKVSNLINMMARTKHSVVVTSDSDIEVAPDYLVKISSALQKPGVGAVTCLYHGVPGQRTAGRLSALAINAHFLPSVIMAVSFGLACPCLGATIAFRRETLAKIGGFAAFADQLADDYFIGRAIRAAGLNIEMPLFSVAHACNETTMREFVKRQLRSARTIKSLDPIGYAGAIIVNPLPLAVLAMMNGVESGAFLSIFAFVCRILLYESVVKTFDAPKQRYAQLAMVDFALFAVFFISFFGSSIDWRGRRYRLVPDGTLSHDSN